MTSVIEDNNFSKTSKGLSQLKNFLGANALAFDGMMVLKLDCSISEKITD
jgi:hypothetical protein